MEWNGDVVIAAVARGAMRGIARGTESIRTEAVRMIQEDPKTGRVYTRGSRKHQASAPGEAPATDTGHHLREITTYLKPAEVAGVVNFGTAYSEALEFGTERIAARPVARPALANKIDEIEQDVAAEVAAELR